MHDSNQINININPITNDSKKAPTQKGYGDQMYITLPNLTIRSIGLNLGQHIQVGVNLGWETFKLGQVQVGLFIFGLSSDNQYARDKTVQVGLFQVRIFILLSSLQFSGRSQIRFSRFLWQPILGWLIFCFFQVSIYSLRPILYVT